MAKLELERERLNEQIDRVRLRPKLDAVAGAMQDEISYDLDVSRRDRYASVFIGIRVSWNIFDGFATPAQVSATRARVRQMEQRLAEIEADVLNAADDAYKELEFATRALDHAESRFRSSQTALLGAKSNFERGRASELDVENAQAAANFGRLNVFRARASYLSSLASFLSAVNADPVAASATREILDR
jgi:outer membrane protein TolC